MYLKLFKSKKIIITSALGYINIRWTLLLTKNTLQNEKTKSQY